MPAQFKSLSYRKPVGYADGLFLLHRQRLCFAGEKAKTPYTERPKCSVCSFFKTKKILVNVTVKVAKANFVKYFEKRRKSSKKEQEKIAVFSSYVCVKRYLWKKQEENGKTCPETGGKTTKKQKRYLAKHPNNPRHFYH